jgi:hypothetical protein
VAGLRADDLQRRATRSGVSQTQIEYLLTFGQALGSCGFQCLQLGLVAGRTKMLDRP